MIVLSVTELTLSEPTRFARSHRAPARVTACTAPFAESEPELLTSGEVEAGPVASRSLDSGFVSVVSEGDVVSEEEVVTVSAMDVPSEALEAGSPAGSLDSPPGEAPSVAQAPSQGTINHTTSRQDNFTIVNL